MDYSKDSLEEIRKAAEDMMKPHEIAGLLGMDEQLFCDDVRTPGNEARRAFLMGYMKTVRQMRQNIKDAADTGSPFALQKCLDCLSQIADHID